MPSKQILIRPIFGVHFIIRPPLFFSSEYGVWKGVRHIQCKTIRKGLRNLSVCPPISFFRDVAGRSYLIVKPNDTPTFVGPK